MSSSGQEFDFDSWAKLAATDSQAFEEKRRETIEHVIEQISPDRQPRLRGLQWRIDVERKKHRHPLAACSQLFNKMWASVYGAGGLSDALQGRLQQQPEYPVAAVLTFSLDRRQRARSVVGS
ncbi:MAG: DUF3135 domain-containing protein [Pseudomonadota bacterium]